MAVASAAALLPGSAAATPPTGNFTISSQVPLVGASVTFTATDLSDPDGGTTFGVHWDFGDTTSGDGTSVSHAYAARGSKTVTMTITDAQGETATVSHSLRVNAPPIPGFTWSPTVPQINQSVAFDGSSSFDPEGAVTFAWNFGDGAVSSAAKPSHPYATSGNKTVTLTVTDSDGVSRFLQQNVRVNAPPSAAFTYAALDRNVFGGNDSQVPFVGQRVAFSAGSSADSDGSIATYEWDFNGDGVFDPPVAASSLITTLSTPGDVTIGLRVTDNDGAKTTFTKRIHVDQRPVPDFTFSPANPTTGQNVQFTSTATDPDGASDIASQSWDLNGDGTFGEAVGPTALATFLTAGTYTVRLRVTDRAGYFVDATHTVPVVGAPAPPPPPPASGPAPVVVPAPFVAPATTSGTSAPGGSSASGAPSTPTAAASPRPNILSGVRVSIAGRVAGSRTRVTQLDVFAPRGAIVRGACKGKGCPSKGERHRAGKSGAVRLKRFQRTLRAGARITVKVTKSGFIGRAILFTIRRGKAPLRSELCLGPGQRATKCPA